MIFLGSIILSGNVAIIPDEDLYFETSSGNVAIIPDEIRGLCEECVDKRKSLSRNLERLFSGSRGSRTPDPLLVRQML